MSDTGGLSRRRWLRLLAGLLVATVAAVMSMIQTRGHLPSGTVAALELESLAGNNLNLASLRGKPTLLEFWAPWCEACGLEAENISWVERLLGESVNIISVALEYQTRDDVAGFAAEHGARYSVLLGHPTTGQQFGLTAYPTIHFLDQAGRIKWSVVGYTSTIGLLVRLFF